MEIIMLNIDSLQNGVVIDHIPAGQGLDIYRLLNLDAQSHSVALLQYVKSEKSCIQVATVNFKGKLHV